MGKRTGETDAMSRNGELTGVQRREFLKHTLLGTSALAFGVLLARSPARAAQLPFSPDYGPLLPAVDKATGLPLIHLPEGFEYETFGWLGDRLSPTFLTPARHDGMAVVAARDNQVVLVRNHEVGNPNLTGKHFAPAVYDPLAGGGTTNLLFDVKQGKWLSSWGSLAGTFTNCSGGPTPWGSWLSCEETLRGPDTISPQEIEVYAQELNLPVDEVAGLVAQLKTHGWVFEVPGFGVASGQPLKGLGRFSHEAVAVDPATGIVYETEDARPSGFYRFVPNTYGRLEQGGKLQMLKVAASRAFNFGGKITGTEADGSTRQEFPSFLPGTEWDVEWVDIDNPEVDFASSDPDCNTPVFQQGYARGGASFSRGEGCWHDSGKIYFTSTDGGGARKGQVYEYDPRREKLSLIFESPGADVLDNPDNITVSPRGGVLLCEDGGGDLKLRGLTRDGHIFPFAQNAINLSAADIVAANKRVPAGDYSDSEWAGASFYGRWLFCNIQKPGITLAITGPWDNGGL